MLHDPQYPGEGCLIASFGMVAGIRLYHLHPGRNTPRRIALRPPRRRPMRGAAGDKRRAGSRAGRGFSTSYITTARGPIRAARKPPESRASRARRGCRGMEPAFPAGAGLYGCPNGTVEQRGFHRRSCLDPLAPGAHLGSRASRRRSGPRARTVFGAHLGACENPLRGLRGGDGRSPSRADRNRAICGRHPGWIGATLKAVIPGGSSVPCVRGEKIAIAVMDFRTPCRRAGLGPRHGRAISS